MVSSRLIPFHLTPCPTLNWSRMWRSTAKDMPRSSWMWVISEPGAGHSKNRDFTCIKWGVHPARMVINHDSPSKSGTSENMWELMVAFCGWLVGYISMQCCSRDSDGFSMIFWPATSADEDHTPTIDGNPSATLQPSWRNARSYVSSSCPNKVERQCQESVAYDYKDRVWPSTPHCTTHSWCP